MCAASTLLRLLVLSAATLCAHSKPTLGARATSKLLGDLLPITPLSSWTTCSDASSALPLSDKTLQATKVASGVTHTYETFAGKNAMQAIYPNGSYTFSHLPRGGISFYASGPASVDLTTAKEATFGYSVYFQEDFEYNKGGKLPGFYGGDTADGAVSCSGGSRNDTCFSARLMWRTNGAGEMYTYLPPSYAANDNVCDVPPFSTCNPTDGASVARAPLVSHLAPGLRYVYVSERVRLNDAGEENGELELFVAGQSVFSVGGLVLRDSAAGRIRGIMVQTFFGGSDTTWASPQDQDAYFADFTVGITETL